MGQLLGFYYFLNQSSLQCSVARVEAEAAVELLVHKTNMPLKPVYEDIDPVLWKRKGFHFVLQYPQQWCYCVMWLAQCGSLVIFSENTAWDVCITHITLRWSCCSLRKCSIYFRHVFFFYVSSFLPYVWVFHKTFSFFAHNWFLFFVIDRQSIKHHTHMLFNNSQRTVL